MLGTVRKCLVRKFPTPLDPFANEKSQPVFFHTGPFISDPGYGSLVLGTL